MVKPPSIIIADAHKMLCAKKMQRNKETITDLAKKTLLPMDHVRMWLEHLDQARCTRIGRREQNEQQQKESQSQERKVFLNVHILSFF